MSAVTALACVIVSWVFIDSMWANYLNYKQNQSVIEKRDKV